jgi:hypothetical protein
MNTTPADGTILKTDVLGRVKRHKEQREQLLDEFEKSGLSGQKFTALAGVRYSTFATWIQKRRRARGAYPAGKQPKHSTHHVPRTTIRNFPFSFCARRRQ